MREGEEERSEWSGTTISGSGSATDNAEETDWSGDRGGHHTCVARSDQPQNPARTGWAPMRGQGEGSEAGELLAGILGLSGLGQEKVNVKTVLVTR